MGKSRSTLRPPSRKPALLAVELRLLNAFQVVAAGEPVELPTAAQRLVAFVALHERPVLRDYVAGTLWLDTSDDHAAGNLRSTLWRIQKRAPGLLRADGRALHLEPAVRVNLYEAQRQARLELRCLDGAETDPYLFAADLLPDWYDDDWVILERERYRQLRLTALDAVCERCLGEGRLGEALEAGLLAVAGEPLRESAHRGLVRVHLAAGNTAEAVRQYELCRRLLRERLGLEPTALMREAIGELDGVETNR